MKELGGYLKKTRIENGVSLEEAAQDMNISLALLENIEDGNTRAFKDIYKLKQHIKFYAKYLGLDPEKVVEEFNDFLFEHTSKISLEDIRKARLKAEGSEEKEKIKSPYTIEHKEKINILPLVIPIGLIIFVLIVIIIVLIGRATRTKPRTSELKVNNYDYIIGECLWIYLQN